MLVIILWTTVCVGYNEGLAFVKEVCGPFHWVFLGGRREKTVKCFPYIICTLKYLRYGLCTIK